MQMLTGPFSVNMQLCYPSETEYSHSSGLQNCIFTSRPVKMSLLLSHFIYATLAVLMLILLKSSDYVLDETPEWIPL